jgi:hypothetical protein
MTGSSRRHAHTGSDAWRTLVAGLATAVAVLCIAGAPLTLAEGLALKLKANVIVPSGPAVPLTIELIRWSTDAERAPLVTALSAPPPAPPSAPATAAAPAAAGRAGRAARGGRGAAAVPPPSPLARLTTAIKAAPTVGFIWSDGPSGYSIKYAWRSSRTPSGVEGSPKTEERVVLVTDRRLGANATSWPSATSGADAEFTVVEMRLDAKGLGEAKSSLTSKVVVDTVASTLALDGYATAPVLLKVTR